MQDREQQLWALDEEQEREQEQQLQALRGEIEQRRERGAREQEMQALREELMQLPTQGWYRTERGPFHNRSTASSSHQVVISTTPFVRQPAVLRREDMQLLTKVGSPH